jgi:eukaryotic-like serine/threonine-protein kinase
MELAEMPTKIGPFEILSELAKSPTCTVYKANDTESGQTIALKAIQLSAFGDAASELEAALVAEAEKTKILSSSNITPVFGAGEIDGLFCAAMEYVQGNSIATMLSRKEGFSIWDLLDIGRQLSAGLDHAASHSIVHYSLEPGKIMCGWDGTVKILSFGVSSVGNFLQHVSEGLPSGLHYMSPEQVQGQATDVRSNLFTLGAIFYEMVTERKAFDGDGIESLRQCVAESTPVPPVQLNAKVHPLLSDLIMKALAKDPAQRYASGRALLDDLEKCKESRPSATAKKTAPAAGVVAPKSVQAAAQSKFVGLASQAAARPAVSVPASPAPIARAQAPKPAIASSPLKNATGAGRPEISRATKSRAAAASSSGLSSTPEIEHEETSSASAEAAIAEPPSAYMSAATAEPEIETYEPQADQPKIAIDPMMADGGQAASTGTSFSDITELPPLKEVYIAPPPPPAEEAEPEPVAPPKPTVFAGTTKTNTTKIGTAKRDEKPKVQTREVAQKAIKEIKSVPPKLMFYALGGAAALILAIGIGVTIYVHQQNSDDDSNVSRAPAPTVTETQTQPAASEPVTPAPQRQEAAPAPAEQPTEPEVSEEHAGRSARTRAAKHKAVPVAPAIVPGQLSLDSTPQGAQVQVDGRTDTSFVTPLTLTNLAPGQHTLTVTKPGYSADTRQINIISGNRATVVIHLSQLMATLVVNSNPTGANVYIDGRDSGVKTPGQVSVNKGQHVVLVRKMGYIDETMSAQFVLGQTFNFAPTLRSLGNVDDIHTVGKMSRLFGGKAQAGQSVVSIRTQPKGAQVAINEHIMEKSTPLEVALDPGNYVIDITMTGYAPVRKVITTDRGGKVVVDEVLQPQ